MGLENMGLEKYYKSSGKFSAIGLILFIFIGLIGSIVLTLVYSLANRFDPLIYFQVVAVFAWAWLLSWFINKLVYIFKIRSKSLIYILGIALILVSLYIHRSIYTSFGINITGSDSIGSGKNSMGISYISTNFAKVISDALGVMLNPDLIIQNMKYLFENGSWSIKGNIIDSWFIVAIWILEINIFGIYTLLNLGDQVARPFSESKNSWMSEKLSGKLKMPLDIKSDNDLFMIKTELENGSYHFLKQLKKGGADLVEYCEINIYMLDNDIDNAYISISNVYETTNKKGEIEKDEKEIVEYLSIPYSLASDLSREYC